MPTINQLSSTDTLSVSDQFPVYSAANGDARKASGTALLAFVEANFASPDYTTVLVAPTVSGFVQPIGSTSDNVWLIINAATTLAAGTVQLPPASSAIDGQQVMVTSQNAITTLTVTSSGATVSGAPSTLASGAFFAMRYSKTLTTWYCVAMVLTGISTLSTITLTSDTATIKDVNGQTSLELSKNYAGVTAGNFVRVTNRSTGNGPQIQAQGVDANVALSVSAKGTGTLSLGGSGTTQVVGSTVSVEPTTDFTVTNISGTSTVNSGAVVIKASNAAIDIDQNNVGTIFGRVTQTSTCTLAQANTAVALLAVGRRVGAKATITDSATAPTGNFNAVIAGGGANTTPAWYDGTNWRIG